MQMALNTNVGGALQYKAAVPWGVRGGACIGGVRERGAGCAGVGGGSGAERE